MSQEKLTIVPVTLHAKSKNLASPINPTTPSTSICKINAANLEISFFRGVDELTIQTVMRELKNL